MREPESISTMAFSLTALLRSFSSVSKLLLYGAISRLLMVYDSRTPKASAHSAGSGNSDMSASLWRESLAIVSSGEDKSAIWPGSALPVCALCIMLSLNS